MAPVLALAAVMITGALTTTGVQIDEDTSSVTVDAGHTGSAYGSLRAVQRRDDDEDSDSERRRGRVRGRDDRGRDDEDSDRRRGRVTRDRDRGNRFPAPRDTGVARIAFEYGADDGYDRGLEDGRDRSRHDPTRHRDYRSADRGYESRFGSREQYRAMYRDGFRDGYDRGYRDGEGAGTGRAGRTRLPWPF